jgi:PHD/YefM family antitoxin component YafN of YafNO toxin-antitoxin module
MMPQVLASRAFVHGFKSAKRAAVHAPVLITERGEPAFALLNIAEYRRLTQTSKSGKSLLELLRLPDADAYDFDPEPVRFEAQDIE